MIATSPIFTANIPILFSERLILSPIREDDADDYFALCSNPDVMRPWGTKQHQNLNETKNLILFLEHEFKKKQMIRWGIREQSAGHASANPLIGDLGFWRFVNPRLRAEIGAKLSPQYWNKGYMTEAMTKVLDFGFQTMNLNSIEGNIDPENRSSMRMLEKLGFDKEGYIKGHSYCAFREKFVDTLLYSLRANQWNLKQPSL